MAILRIQTLRLIASMTSVMDEVVDVDGVEVSGAYDNEAVVSFCWHGNTTGTIRISQPATPSSSLTVSFNLISYFGEQIPSQSFQVSEGESPIFSFIRENLT